MASSRPEPSAKKSPPSFTGRMPWYMNTSPSGDIIMMQAAGDLDQSSIGSSFQERIERTDLVEIQVRKLCVSDTSPAPAAYQPSFVIRIFGARPNRVEPAVISLSAAITPLRMVMMVIVWTWPHQSTD